MWRLRVCILCTRSTEEVIEQRISDLETPRLMNTKSQTLHEKSEAFRCTQTVPIDFPLLQEPKSKLGVLFIQEDIVKCSCQVLVAEL